MFIKICLFAFLVHSTYAIDGGDSKKCDPFQAILNSKLMTCDRERNLNLDVSRIKIHFFDFSKNFSASFPIKNAATKILKIKNLDKTRKFVMFVGGYTSQIDDSVHRQMQEAYKTYPNSYLVIPEHSAYTNKLGDLCLRDIIGIQYYKRAVLHVHSIGKALGLMLAKLKFGGVSSKKIHCVGHSLGGQILGHVGSTFFNKTGKKIARLTALDPAGPCFVNMGYENQVRSGVAEYVEVYHSNAGSLGSSSVLGDVDFFMNQNGEMNPSCKPRFINFIRSSKTASCNHRVCIDVWTASVKHPHTFWAYKCQSYKIFKKGNCTKNLKIEAGSGNGESRKATGKFYFTTDKFDLRALA